MFSLRRFLRSLKHALAGLDYVLRHERNFQVEILVAFLVGVAGLVLNVDRVEWIIVVFIVFWVLALELANTAVERIINVLKPTLHPYARVIKDVMAASVLMSAIAATLIGMAIFLPYILDYF